MESLEKRLMITFLIGGTYFMLTLTALIAGLESGETQWSYSLKGIIIGIWAIMNIFVILMCFRKK